VDKLTEQQIRELKEFSQKYGHYPNYMRPEWIRLNINYTWILCDQLLEAEAHSHREKVKAIKEIAAMAEEVGCSDCADYEFKAVSLRDIEALISNEENNHAEPK
jgi:hypothetical protein